MCFYQQCVSDCDSRTTQVGKSVITNNASATAILTQHKEAKVLASTIVAQHRVVDTSTFLDSGALAVLPYITRR